jgi:hypothetical protein
MEAEEHVNGSTRRRLLLGAMTGLTSAGGVLVATRAAASTRDPDGDEGWICATLEAVAAPDRITVRETGAAEAIDVGLTAATEINRDGPATIAAFSIGETVLLLLEDDDAVPRIALRLQTVYYRVDDVQVMGRGGRRLRVAGLPRRATRNRAAAEIALTSRTAVPDRFLAGGRRAPGKPLADIGPGDRVYAVGRFDPTQHAFVAVAVQAEE